MQICVICGSKYLIWSTVGSILISPLFWGGGTALVALGSDPSKEFKRMNPDYHECFYFGYKKKAQNKNANSALAGLGIGWLVNIIILASMLGSSS